MSFSPLAFAVVKNYVRNSRVLFGLCCALVVVASSCGVTRGDNAAAASLSFPDGSETNIEASEYDAIVASISESERFVETAFQGEIPAGFEAQVLTGLIVESSIDELLDNEGVTVEQSAIDTKYDELGPAVNQLFSDEAVTEEVTLELDAYLRSLARLQAKQEALGLKLGEGAEGTRIPCARHILVSDEELINTIAQQIADGEDFAELALTHSEDPGSGQQGGSLGCASPERYVDEFRNAILAGSEGELLGPIETQFGFHLIEIESYEEQPADVDGLVESAITDLLSESAITVDVGIGTWDTITNSVLASSSDLSSNDE